MEHCVCYAHRPRSGLTLRCVHCGVYPNGERFIVPQSYRLPAYEVSRLVAGSRETHREHCSQGDPSAVRVASCKNEGV